MLKKSVIIASLMVLGLVGFSGCSTHIPVKKEVGQLNLKNVKFKKQDKTNKVIAIVSPEFSMKDANSNAHNTASNNPYQNMLMARRGVIKSVNFQKKFFTTYRERLSQALETSISEMLSSKGFKLQGPYANFDDMTYREKKKIYLAFVPKIDFQIEKKPLNEKHERLYYHEDGVIQIGGSLIITMVEPLTGEVFLKKRINLSNFNIKEPYIYEKQTRLGGGIGIDSALDKASAPDSLKDTTDVALTKAINKFYVKAIEKINRYLDREEILSYEKDILKLKGLKRF